MADILFMKTPTLILSALCLTLAYCSKNSSETSNEPVNQLQTTPMATVDLTQYPSTEIANDQVSMKIYLPDKERGLYRATRFDWSGVIGSVQYQGHEYFGYWKDTHDPMVHEDLTGPVEGYIEPGLGYKEAKPGDGFIRIGVGIIEKPDETEYRMFDTYKILDPWKLANRTRRRLDCYDS